MQWRHRPSFCCWVLSSRRSHVLLHSLEAATRRDDEIAPWHYRQIIEIEICNSWPITWQKTRDVAARTINCAHDGGIRQNSLINRQKTHRSNKIRHSLDIRLVMGQYRVFRFRFALDADNRKWRRISWAVMKLIGHNLLAFCLCPVIQLRLFMWCLQCTDLPQQASQHVILLVHWWMGKTLLTVPNVIS